MKRRLEGLRQRIISEVCVKRWLDPWFFPTRYGVSGWAGYGPVMFVGLNPSRGNFASNADKLFYSTLLRLGLKNSHLTDVFKFRATPLELKERLMDRRLVGLSRNFFLEEIQLLKPRLVVGLGFEAEEWVRDWLPSVHLLRVRHYSWANRYGKRRDFMRDMTAVGNVGTGLRSTPLRGAK